jgi:hypothetical protein
LGNQIGEALVDQDLAPWINQFNWYPSSAKVPAPPKTTLRVLRPGSKHLSPFNLQLNRFVFLLSTLRDENRTKLIHDHDKLQVLSTSIQRLRFLNHNQRDCRIDNISGVLTQRQERYQARKAEFGSRLRLRNKFGDTTTEFSEEAIPQGINQGRQPDFMPIVQVPEPEPSEPLPPPVDPDLFDGTRTINTLKELFGKPEEDQSQPRSTAEPD